MIKSLSSHEWIFSGDYTKTSSSPQTLADIYHNISVIKQLTFGRFPVYLVRSKATNQHFTMETFPYEEGKPNRCYLSELRFLRFRHPNIIQILYLEDEKKTTTKGVASVISFKIMEYAPYGNLLDFMLKNANALDDKLIRTYFKQLIDGLEYLHNNGVAHIDLKLENLSIGNDFVLKIANYDLSCCKDEDYMTSKGVRLYRAPEVIEENCKDLNAADIYSAGVILFVLKTKGIFPHAENERVNGVDFFELLKNNDSQFWIEHCEIQSKEDSFFEDEFRELFTAMTDANVIKRASVAEIKASRWYNGPCYNEEELKNKLKRVFWK